MDGTDPVNSLILGQPGINSKKQAPSKRSCPDQSQRENTKRLYMKQEPTRRVQNCEPHRDQIQLGDLNEAPLFTRHENMGNKTLNWDLDPRRPIQIIGDSNLQKLPLIKDHRVQTDCYPGSTFYHAVHMLKSKQKPQIWL